MIVLPDSPRPKEWVPALYPPAQSIQPPLGGPEQRVVRAGQRWEITFTMNNMKAEDANTFAGLENTRDLVRMPIYQDVSTVNGDIRVSGGNQSGSTLVLDGFMPGFIVEAGRFFSVAVGGRQYLYRTQQQAIVNESGVATLAINPMIRVTPADNAIVTMNDVFIDGFVVSGWGGIGYGLGRMVAGFDSFTVREVR